MQVLFAALLEQDFIQWENGFEDRTKPLEENLLELVRSHSSPSNALQTVPSAGGFLSHSPNEPEHEPTVENDILEVRSTWKLCLS